MRKSKGFTLIELMVVILIVAILAAVLTPMMTGRINSAKWSEGRAAAGTIVTALRAFAAETEGDMASVGALDGTASSYLGIGITDGDLAGKYFQASSYVTTYTLSGTRLATITIVITNASLTPTSRTLTVTLPATGQATSVWNPA
jgi:prepilin-type N-terminal cleavage/methylation domain-containing protein